MEYMISSDALLYIYLSLQLSFKTCEIILKTTESTPDIAIVTNPYCSYYKTYVTVHV